jgi:ribosomal protein S18 acetylase RimI-like enzyme
MSAAIRIEWREGDPGPAFEAAATAGMPAEPTVPGMGTAVAWRGDEPVARLSTHIREALTGAPGRSGLIGHFASQETEAGVALLRAASDLLRSRGVDRVLGPINGSTWARYRLALPVAEREAESSPGGRAEPAAPFLGEPQNPAAYVEQFIAAGLAPVAHYASTIGRLDAGGSARDAERAARVAAEGIVVAPLRMEAFDGELRTLHALSLRAFADNLYFSPIGEDEFLAMYAPMQRLLDPALVLLARDAAGALIGYILTYADPVVPGRLVIKTIAVAPEWRSLGLGGHLTATVRRAGHERGFVEGIHALMHVENASTRIAAEQMRLFRRYALFGVSLR